MKESPQTQEKLDTIPCPNCGTDMLYGGVCKDCGHVNSDECNCEYCLDVDRDGE